MITYTITYDTLDIVMVRAQNKESIMKMVEELDKISTLGYEIKEIRSKYGLVFTTKKHGNQVKY